MLLARSHEKAVPGPPLHAEQVGEAVPRATKLKLQSTPAQGFFSLCAVVTEMKMV